MGDIEPTSRELHYVSFCLGTKGAWGHASPETIFSLRLLRLHRHISLTLFMPSNFRSKLSAVFDDLQLDDEELQRLRRVWYECPEESPFDANTGEVDDGQYRKWGDWMGSLVVSKYADYMRGASVAEPPHSSPHPRPPDVIFCDLHLLRGFRPYLQAVSQSCGVPMPRTVRLMPTSLAFATLWYGGRQTVFGRAVRAYMTEVDAGVSRDGAYEKTFAGNEDLLETESGLGPMFVSELNPNDPGRSRKRNAGSKPEHHPHRLNIHLSSIHTMIEDAGHSGTVTFWPSCFGRPGSWCENSFYQVGPQLLSNEPSREEATDPTMTWLHQQTQRRGEHSVIFLSFGTHLWPPDLDQTKAMLDALAASSYSVLLVNSSRKGGIAESCSDWAMQMGDRARSTNWVTQRAVLEHPALAAFFTHGGSNSAQESMLSACPMIIFPGGWDQPLIASEVQELGMGIELVQGRSGRNVGRRTALGQTIKGTPEALGAELVEVLDSMRGDKGKAMRLRARQVRQELVKDMSDGGAWRTMWDLGNIHRDSH